jgi:hypothetical protein
VRPCYSKLDRVTGCQNCAELTIGERIALGHDE